MLQICCNILDVVRGTFSPRTLLNVRVLGPLPICILSGFSDLVRVSQTSMATKQEEFWGTKRHIQKAAQSSVYCSNRKVVGSNHGASKKISSKICIKMYSHFYRDFQVQIMMVEVVKNVDGCHCSEWWQIIERMLKIVWLNSLVGS